MSRTKKQQEQFETQPFTEEQLFSFFSTKGKANGFAYQLGEAILEARQKEAFDTDFCLNCPGKEYINDHVLEDYRLKDFCHLKTYSEKDDVYYRLGKKFGKPYFLVCYGWKEYYEWEGFWL
jgi:hypothetical protein